MDPRQQLLAAAEAAALARTVHITAAVPSARTRQLVAASEQALSPHRGTGASFGGSPPRSAQHSAASSPLAHLRAATTTVAASPTTSAHAAARTAAVVDAMSCTSISATSAACSSSSSASASPASPTRLHVHPNGTPRPQPPPIEARAPRAARSLCARTEQPALAAAAQKVADTPIAMPTTTLISCADLPLPSAYATLFDLFVALETVLMFQHTVRRREYALYQHARDQVETATRRSFSLHTLAQIAYVMPDAYDIVTVELDPATVAAAAVATAAGVTRDRDMTYALRIQSPAQIAHARAQARSTAATATAAAATATTTASSALVADASASSLSSLVGSARRRLAMLSSGVAVLPIGAGAATPTLLTDAVMTAAPTYSSDSAVATMAYAPPVITPSRALSLSPPSLRPPLQITDALMIARRAEFRRRLCVLVHAQVAAFAAGHRFAGLPAHSPFAARGSASVAVATSTASARADAFSADLTNDLGVSGHAASVVCECGRTLASLQCACAAFAAWPTTQTHRFELDRCISVPCAPLPAFAARVDPLEALYAGIGDAVTVTASSSLGAASRLEHDSGIASGIASASDSGENVAVTVIDLTVDDEEQAMVSSSSAASASSSLVAASCALSPPPVAKRSRPSSFSSASSATLSSTPLLASAAAASSSSSWSSSSSHATSTVLSPSISATELQSPPPRRARSFTAIHVVAPSNLSTTGAGAKVDSEVEKGASMVGRPSADMPSLLFTPSAPSASLASSPPPPLLTATPIALSGALLHTRTPLPTSSWSAAASTLNLVSSSLLSSAATTMVMSSPAPLSSSPSSTSDVTSSHRRYSHLISPLLPTTRGDPHHQHRHRYHIPNLHAHNYALSRGSDASDEAADAYTCNAASVNVQSLSTSSSSAASLSAAQQRAPVLLMSRRAASFTAASETAGGTHGIGDASNAANAGNATAARSLFGKLEAVANHAPELVSIRNDDADCNQHAVPCAATSVRIGSKRGGVCDAPAAADDDPMQAGDLRGDDDDDRAVAQKHAAATARAAALAYFTIVSHSDTDNNDDM